MDAGDDTQMENLRDRLLLKGYSVFIASRRVVVEQLHHYDWSG